DLADEVTAGLLRAFSPGAANIPLFVPAYATPPPGVRRPPTEADQKELARGFIALGKNLQKQEDWLNAVPAFGDAIQVEPTNALAYRLRSYAYRQLNQLDRAKSDINTAIRLDPSSEYAFRHRGYLRFLNHDWDLALSDLSFAIERDARAVYSRNLRGVV